MAIACIARTSDTNEEVKNNLDVDRISQLISELVDIDYKELDFDFYKKILDEIERPYAQIEDAKFEIWKRNNPESFEEEANSEQTQSSTLR